MTAYGILICHRIILSKQSQTPKSFRHNFTHQQRARHQKNWQCSGFCFRVHTYIQLGTITKIDIEEKKYVCKIFSVLVFILLLKQSKQTHECHIWPIEIRSSRFLLGWSYKKLRVTFMGSRN